MLPCWYYRAWLSCCLCIRQEQNFQDLSPAPLCAQTTPYHEAWHRKDRRPGELLQGERRVDTAEAVREKDPAGEPTPSQSLSHYHQFLVLSHSFCHSIFTIFGTPFDGSKLGILRND